MGRDNSSPGGYVSATGQSTMEDYDNLPPKARKFLQDAPIKLSANSPGLSNITSDRWQEEINRHMKRETIHAYGPDHPQAKG